MFQAFQARLRKNRDGSVTRGEPSDHHKLKNVSACINIATLLPAVFLFDYSSNTRCYSICN